VSARRWSRSFAAARPSAAGFGSGAASSIAARACAVRGIPAAPSSPSSVSMPLAPLAPVPLSPLLLPLAAVAASLSMLHRGCAWVRATRPVVRIIKRRGKGEEKKDDFRGLVV